MRIKNIDAAWIAGIYEGEGSITVYGGSGPLHKYVRIMVYNNDISMLYEIQRILGGKVYERFYKRPGNWNRSFVWYVQRKEDINKFLKYIFPYMRTSYKIKQLTDIMEISIKNGANYIWPGKI